MFETSPNSQATAMNVEFSLNNNKQKLVDLSFRLIQTFDWSENNFGKIHINISWGTGHYLLPGGRGAGGIGVPVNRPLWIWFWKIVMNYNHSANFIGTFITSA